MYTKHSTQNTSSRENQYLELGNIEDVTDKIELHFALEKDCELTTIVFSFNATEGCDK
jgi:hypothetical protein